MTEPAQMLPFDPVSMALTADERIRGVQVHASAHVQNMNSCVEFDLFSATLPRGAWGSSAWCLPIGLKIV